jgi:hypothetical protein
MPQNQYGARDRGKTTWYHDLTDGHYRQSATVGGKPQCLASATAESE